MFLRILNLGTDLFIQGLGWKLGVHTAEGIRFCRVHTGDESVFPQCWGIYLSHWS